MPVDFRHIPAELRAVLPAQLTSYRTQRFGGETLSATLDAFDADDQHRLQHIYATLLDLFALIKPHQEQPAQARDPVLQWMDRIDWNQFIHTVQQLGASTLASTDNNQRLRPVLHDLRGGSFLALSVNLQLIQSGVGDADDLLHVFFLVRDHLKMMRNCVLDLDPERTARDSDQRSHSVRLLVEKWRETTHKLPGHAARIVLDCQFDGSVSERCIEFAALDRVLYNLINNAARFAIDRTVYVSIAPVEQSPHNLRFIVADQISDGHRATLHARFGDDLSQLFRGGFTTDGSGLGMRIVADFVADAYGVHTLERCLSERYVGAALLDDLYVNWFHWPIAAD